MKTQVQRHSTVDAESSSLSISSKNLLRIAMPVCAGQLLTLALVVTDNYFMSQLGRNEMSGVATVGLMYITLAMVGIGLAGGAQILIARRCGEKKYEDAGATFANAVALALGFALISFLLLKFCSPWLISRFVESPNVAAVMNQFVGVRSYGLLIFMITVVFNGFYTGMANTKIVGASTALAAILNIVLCYMFVFGRWGFPQLGVVGAAWANVLAEFSALLLILSYTIFSKQIGNFNLRNSFFKIRFEKTKRILSLGGPMIIQLVLSLGIWTVFFLLIEKLGEKQLQAAHIIRTCYLLALVSIMGFTQTTRTVVSTLIAEKRQGELWLAIKRLMWLNFAGMIILIHGLLLYPEWLAHFFTSDAQVIEYTRLCMAIVFPALLCFAFTSILLNTVEGSGNTMAGMLIEMLTTVGYIWLTYYLTITNPHPVHYVWMADWLYFAGIGIFSMLFLRFSNWKYTAI